jgi:hypothetical protein
MKHTYDYRQFLQNLPDFRSKGGGVFLLKRDDGKKVKVSRKRYYQLENEGRITFKSKTDGSTRQRE